MLNLTKIFIIFGIGLALILGAGTISAQEAASTVDASQEVNLDETVQAQDLEVKEPTILPDSPFYFLKEWGRGVQSFFAFNPAAKAKLKEKFANEKLLELKKTIERSKGQEKIEKAVKNYQKETEKVKIAAEKIKEKAGENKEVGKFLDKFIQHQILQQKVLQKLEEQAPKEVFEKIKEARERHLEKFGEVMNRLEDKEKIQERLEKNLQETPGSKFKNFKNLEILKKLEEKVPEAAKEAIQKAQENTLKRLKDDLEKMSSENQEKFKGYIEKISGEKEKQLEIMEDLKTKIKNAPETAEILELKEKLKEGKTKILEKIEKRLEKLDCPLWAPQAPDFCKEGRVIYPGIDAKTGCPQHPKCIIPGEIELPEKPAAASGIKACIALWNPVCGKNGKTYSNACFAKLAGIEINYKGECKEKQCQTDADCPQVKCGPIGTIAAKCIGLANKCLEGQCKIISAAAPLQP